MEEATVDLTAGPFGGEGLSLGGDDLKAPVPLFVVNSNEYQSQLNS